MTTLLHVGEIIAATRVALEFALGADTLEPMRGVTVLMLKEAESDPALRKPALRNCAALYGQMAEMVQERGRGGAG